MKNSMKMTVFVLISACVMFGVPLQSIAAWPERPIKTVITARAGGGSDMNARAYTKAMEKFLKVKINCTNRPGAVGGLAMDLVYSKPSNGYWFLGSSNYNKSNRVMGGTKQHPLEWQYYKASNSIMGWAVRPDSPLKTMQDFLDAMRKSPGKYKVTSTDVGSPWHLGNLLLSGETKIDFGQTIPYSGGSRACLALLQGEVDVVASGVHEQIEFVRAGKMRNLAVFTKEPITLKGGKVLRPITDFVPSMAKYSPYGGEYTLGVKRDTPVEILEKIKDAFIKAVNSPEYAGLLEKKYLFKNIVTGEDADRGSLFAESVASWLLWDNKIQGVKFNPADLGIPKPENFEASWPPKGYKPRIK